MAMELARAIPAAESVRAEEGLRLIASKCESILVFPAGMPSSLAFAHKMSSAGRRVIGASSLAHDPDRARYSDFVRLPWVLDADFGAALAELLVAQDVSEIFTPHPVVWERLQALLPHLPGHVYLHPQDWDKEFLDYSRQRQMAEDLAARTWPTFEENARPPLGIAQLAGLFRMFEITPGQCSHTKLEALLSVFRDLPAGDVVEIGSLFGRSAVALAFLARRYRTGQVLCVDPWAMEQLKQGTAEVDQHSSKVPIDAVFEAFTANLAPWYGTVNYVRKPSSAGAKAYASGSPVITREFGVSVLCGTISLLHLDGNHAYEAIRDDLRSWIGFVRPEGWIVFDDYRWPFGDGPQRVADEFCEGFRQKWSTAFECGGALFVRLSERIRPGEI